MLALETMYELDRVASQATWAMTAHRTGRRHGERYGGVPSVRARWCW